MASAWTMTANAQRREADEENNRALVQVARYSRTHMEETSPWSRLRGSRRRV